MTAELVVPTEPSIGLLAELERAGAIAADKGLTFPPDLPYERYEAIGALLRFAGDAINWYVGDWLLYGEHTYGDKYHQAAEVIGLAPQTLMNLRSVAARVPPQRRRLSVKHSHHAEVAALPPNDQRHLLKRAETENLSKMELRRIVRGVTEDQFEDVSRDVCEACGRPMP